MSLQECHKLYDRLDKVVNFNALMDKSIDQITLKSSDYELFAEYNSAREDGTYHYRKLLIRQSV